MIVDPVQREAGPIRLMFAGTHRRAENVRPHAHPCPELILVNEGACDVHVEDRAIHAGPGELIAMPARQVHDQVSDGYIDTVYCGFVEPHAMAWTRPRVVPLRDAAFIGQCMQLLAAVHYRQVQASEPAASALVAAVLEQINHLHQQHEQTTHIPAHLRAAMRYLEDHLDQPITMDTLAHHTRMSASNLHLLFRTHLKVSPMRYLHDQRMRAARGALQVPYISIKEVAAICGYADVNHFVRTFRKAHRLPPGQWRQQQMIAMTP